MEEKQFETYMLKPSFEDGRLKTNAAQLASQVMAKLTEYQYRVTDANYSKAKEDRAKLNNLAKTLSSTRQNVETVVFGDWAKDKQLIMSIEKKCKEIANDLGSGISGIDEEAKVKRFEELKEQFNSLGGSKYSFEKVVAGTKWQNKSATKKSIEEEMKTKIDELKKGEQFVIGMVADIQHKDAVWNIWYQYMDTTRVVAEVQRIKQYEEPVVKPEPKPVPQPQPKAGSQSTGQEEKTYWRQFEIECNYTQLVALDKFIRENGIKLVSVKKEK